MFRWFEHRQVYHPTRHWDNEPASLNTPFEDLALPVADGVRLSAWFFPSRPDSPRIRYAVLICHGNGGNISHRLGLTRALLDTGVNVLLFDYCGYGHSTGKPSEPGTYLDAQTAYHWLRQRGFAPDHIIALGESLGGAIACELATREPLAGLILQSTFTSIPDIGAEHYPWLPVRRFHTIKYDTYKKLPALKLPILVVHSPEDERVRFHHGQKNFAAITAPKLFWETRGTHNQSLRADPSRTVAGLEKFLELIESHHPS